jgi:hypothetical protein
VGKLVADFQPKTVYHSIEFLKGFLAAGGKIEHVLRIHTWPVAEVSPFNAYVRFLVSQRQAARKRGDETSADSCKLSMNSLYGKTLQRYLLRCHIYRSYRAGKPGLRKALQDPRLVDFVADASGNTLCKFAAETALISEMPNVGCFILMRAREILYGIWNDIKTRHPGVHTALYTDTDSIVISSTQNPFLLFAKDPVLAPRFEFSECSDLHFPGEPAPFLTPEMAARKGTLGLLACESYLVREMHSLAPKVYAMDVGTSDTVTLNPTYLKAGATPPPPSKATLKQKGVPAHRITREHHAECARTGVQPEISYESFIRGYANVYTTKLMRRALAAEDTKRDYLGNTGPAALFSLPFGACPALCLDYRDRQRTCIIHHEETERARLLEEFHKVQ